MVKISTNTLFSLFIMIVFSLIIMPSVFAVECNSNLNNTPCEVTSNLTLITGVYDFGEDLDPNPLITLGDNAYLNGNGSTIIIDNYNETTFVSYGDVIIANGSGGVSNLHINSSNAPLVVLSQTTDDTFYINNTVLELNGDIPFGLALYVGDMRNLYVTNNTFIGRTIFETQQFYYGSKVYNNRFFGGPMQPADNVIQFGLQGFVSSGISFYNNSIETGIDYKFQTTDFFSDVEDVNNNIQFRGTNDKYVILTYYNTTSRTYEQIKSDRGFTTGLYYGEGFGTPITFDIDIDTSYISMTKNSVNIQPSSNMDSATLIFREISNGQTINGTFSENYVLLKDNVPYANQGACSILDAFGVTNSSVECGVSGYGVYELVSQVQSAQNPIYKDKFVFFHDFENKNATAWIDYYNTSPLINTFGNLQFGVGKYGSSVYSNGDEHEIYNLDSYIGESVSVGYWVYLVEYTTLTNIIEDCLTPNSPNQLNYVCSSENVITNFNELEYYHITHVYDSTTQEETIYLNGFPVVTINSLSTSTLLNDSTLTVGGIIGHLFQMDDLFMYEGTLEQEQIINISTGSTTYVDSLPISLYAPSSVDIIAPVGNHTLNSTGKLFSFAYTESDSNPNAKYDVYFTNGFINYSVREQTTLNIFNEVVSTSTVPISGEYNILVRSNNSQGESLSLSNYTLNFCVNVWNASYTTCVNDTQIKFYEDLNSCSEQYDKPADDGEIVSCDDGILTETEIEQNKLSNTRAIFSIILIIMFLGFSFILMTYGTTLSTVFSLALSIITIILLISSKTLLFENSFEPIWALLLLINTLVFIMSVLSNIAKLIK